MKVTFLKDHQSYYSGHEFYPAGAKASLTGGQTLVDMGVAREGWGPPPGQPPEPKPVHPLKAAHPYKAAVSFDIPEPPEPKPEPNKKVPALELQKVQMYDLRQMGKAQGIKGYSKMRKADLIAALLED